MPLFVAGPQALERNLKLATASIEPAAIAAQLAHFAKKSLADAQREGVAPLSYTRIVNGRVGVPEEQVILPGPIVYEFNNLPEIAEYALAFARSRSPVESGRYRNSWFAMKNGERVSDLSEIEADDEVVITNGQPYARKIEVGAMTMRVPPGIVEDTRQATMRQFGNIVVVERKFIHLTHPYILRTGKRRGQELTYPAVVINTRGF